MLRIALRQYRNQSTTERFTLIICFIIAFAMYIGGDYQYNYGLCLANMIVYIISSIIVIVNNIKHYNRLATFVLFFSFSFLIVNYFYPVFFYLEDREIKLFQYDFAEKAIQKSTYIATMAGTILNLALYEDSFVTRVAGYSYNIKIYKWEVWLMALLNISYLIVNKAFFTQGYDDVNIGGSGLTSYLGYSVLLLYYLIFKDLYICGKKTHNFEGYLKNGNKGVLIMAVLLIIAWIFIGKRTIALRVGLIFLFSYSFFIRKISLAKLLPIVIVGFLLMFLSGLFRNNKEGFSSDAILSSLSVQKVAYYGTDLAINARSLYELVDYADQHGVNYGTTMISDIASVVPTLQSAIINTFGISQYKTSSAVFVTWLYYGNQPFDIGLGTNLVGDVYVSFGLIGVLIMFFILGKMIKRAERGCNAGNFKYLLLYCIFICEVIFYPRSSILSPLRNMIWIWVIYLLDVYINNQRKWHAS